MRHLFFFTALMLSFVGTASAQFGISLDLAYSRTGYSFIKSGLSSHNETLPVGQSFQCAPRIGYRFGEFFECGVDLGIANSINTYTAVIYDADVAQWVESSLLQNTMMTANAGGYLRFLIHDFGHFSFHAELCGGYLMGWGKERTTEYESHSGFEINTHIDLRQRQFYAKVVPVFNYSFPNHFSMDVYMDFASLVYTHNTAIRYTQATGSNTSTDIDTETVTDDLAMGLHTLNTSIITLGFSYSF